MSKKSPLIKEIIELFGKETDQTIGLKYGLSRQRIHQIRKKLGIKPYNEKINIWDIEIPDLTISNKIIREQTNLSNNAIRKRRHASNIRYKKEKIDWSAVQFGEMNDEEIAEKYNISINSVCSYRKKHNIPCVKRTKNFWKRGPKRFEITKEMIELFGKMPDISIARLFNCGKLTIAKRRKELGISSFKSNRLKEKKK